MCNMLQLPRKARRPQQYQQSYGSESESHHESRTRRDVVRPEEYGNRCIFPLRSRLLILLEGVAPHCRVTDLETGNSILDVFQKHG
jgi:hypothetical protein